MIRYSPREKPAAPAEPEKPDTAPDEKAEREKEEAPVTEETKAGLFPLGGVMRIVIVGAAAILAVFVLAAVIISKARKG